MRRNQRRFHLYDAITTTLALTTSATKTVVKKRLGLTDPCPAHNAAVRPAGRTARPINLKKSREHENVMSVSVLLKTLMADTHLLPVAEVTVFTEPLTNQEETEVITFLAERPLHTYVWRLHSRQWS